MKYVVHPGPARDSRMDLVPCSGSEISVQLEAGMPLEEAVAAALSPLDLDSAWLEIDDAAVSTLRYVIPAVAPDDTHAAWYSEPKSLENGHIDRLGMIVGWHAGASFLHGHGTWLGSQGDNAMGHILAAETVLAAPVTARGFGLRGARFERRADPETNFELFHVDQTRSAAGDFAALRLLPNQDLSEATDMACKTLGWATARAHGLGSINTPQFEDGRELDSLPTEFLILDALAGPDEPGPNIVIVGTDPLDIQTGRLSRGKNSVLITAELVLRRMG